MRDVMVMVRGKGEGREMLTKPTQYLLHFTFIMEIHCQSGAAGGHTHKCNLQKHTRRYNEQPIHSPWSPTSKYT